MVVVFGGSKKRHSMLVAPWIAHSNIVPVTSCQNSVVVARLGYVAKQVQLTGPICWSTLYESFVLLNAAANTAGGW